MIEIDLIILIIIAIIFGTAFFIADFFEHKHHQLHISLIAGISVAYFFLVVLPEVASGMPEYLLNFEIFEYFFILMGFIFFHVSEKLILQKVESKSQKRMRKLLKMEKDLEFVEENIENVLESELQEEKLDIAALKNLNESILGLKEQEKTIKKEIDQYKLKIQNHLNKDLSEFRFFTNFTYHLLVGIILVGLLFIEFLAAFLFFIFAWFRIIISNRSERHIIFTDLEIYEETDYGTNLIKKTLLGLAALTGVFIGLVFELVLPIKIELELIYILFSFISGVILYTIVREVIPEKEKGNPLYFLVGAVGFIIIILFIKIFTNLI
ncbi:MAG: hypothetical protein EU540_07910 [Promethearchaeota archaeon]|nr:MAG: hypothetical protein EU540_07910 [Candidatus Lokiarchaeota archaeon]